MGGKCIRLSELGGLSFEVHRLTPRRHLRHSFDHAGRAPARKYGSRPGNTAGRRNPATDDPAHSIVMISEWGTYSIRDFIPFTPDVYARLIERTNENLWPLQLLALATGVGILLLFHICHPRIAILPLALIWVWVGYAFLIQDYAGLTSIGFWFGWVFCLEGLFVLGFGMAGWFRRTAVRASMASAWMGLVIVAYGLLIYPALTWILGGSWIRSEVFGIHPDPTAIVTLGILLLTTKGWCLWVLAVIPIFWCITSGLTLMGLESALAPSPFAVSALALMGMVWSLCEEGRGPEPIGFRC